MPVTRLLFIVLITLAGAAMGNESNRLVPSEPEAWGAAPSVVRVGNLFIAGDLDDASLDRARSEGVRTVINLLSEDELAKATWEEAPAVAERGMTYHHVPVSGAFQADQFEQVEAILAEQEALPALVHCASGNRAAGWLATHLVLKHGLTVDEAIAVARKSGITKDAAEQAARAYLLTTQ